MQKARLAIKRRDEGVSVVEVLLAATLFGTLVVAMGSAAIYGRTSTADAGDRSRATLLAEEGLEAVRNIRDNNYGNLVDGTFGLTQSANQWVLSGSSDTNGIYTRSVTVASNGANRKSITSNVSWSSGSISRQTNASTQLTNWMASIVKSWTNPGIRGTLDANGTNDAIKVATLGNYAYVVRNDGTPDFMVINISNPASPTLVGSLSLAGVPTNIAVNTIGSNIYAYVTNTSDTAELQIIEVTNPASPVLRSSYNASGAADGTAVFASGNYAYVTRKANGGNNEFVAVNVATATLPILAGWYNLNVNMNDVYVSNNAVYLVTDSDTQEVIKITAALLGLITVTSSINLPGTTNATAIAGFNETLLIGQGTTFYTANGSTMATLGSTTVTGTISDIDENPSATYAYIGTSATNAEFQVLSISNLSSPSVVGSVDVVGTASTVSGVAYNATLDLVPAASASDTQEVIVFGPN